MYIFLHEQPEWSSFGPLKYKMDKSMLILEIQNLKLAVYRYLQNIKNSNLNGKIHFEKWILNWN